MSKTPMSLSQRSLARIAEKRAARMGVSEKSAAKSASVQSSKNSGVIYIIGAANGKSPYKIGFSKNPDVRKRLGGIQVSNWVELCVVYKSPIVENVTLLESRIHSRYGEKRMKGEWFSLTKKDIKQIKYEIESGKYSDDKLMYELMLRKAIRHCVEVENRLFLERL